MLRTPLFEGNLEARRRRALAAIFGDIGTEMVDRVVAEAVRASTFFGLTGETAERYGRSHSRDARAGTRGGHRERSCRARSEGERAHRERSSGLG